MFRPFVALATVFLASGVFLISGCSNNTAQMVSSDKLSAFQPGKTNETEVVAALGQPLQLVTEADGTKIAQYPTGGSGGSGSIWPEFLGGDGGTAGGYQMVSFIYDSDGGLKAIRGAPTGK